MPDFIHFLTFIIKPFHIDNHARDIRFNHIWRSDVAVSAISAADCICSNICHLVNCGVKIGRMQREFATVNKLIWDSD